MLAGTVQRLGGGAGDPVVQIQTNFGGGKTHSMLALYHLFSGAAPGDLAGVDAVLRDAGAAEAPSVRRVVLVGNEISPANLGTDPTGPWSTHCGASWPGSWGARGVCPRRRRRRPRHQPGDALQVLFNDYNPCLILIDEWVAYARQLHDQRDLPAGTFETQFTFAQALTESAKLAASCLLVISLPESDTSGSPHAQADDVEVGGARGRGALDRLRNVIGRIESSWRPASAEEGFEIVRRRLFEPFADSAQFKDRDVVARAFAELYRTQHQEFPPECRDADYEKRIKAAYPMPVSSSRTWRSRRPTALGPGSPSPRFPGRAVQFGRLGTMIAWAMSSSSSGGPPPPRSPGRRPRSGDLPSRPFVLDDPEEIAGRDCRR